MVEEYKIGVHGGIPGLLRVGRDSVYNQKFAPDVLQFDEGVEKKSAPGVDIPGVLRFGKRIEEVPGAVPFEKQTKPGVLRFGRR
ncbi:hypothetical protein X798_06169 [Onchocerca flexuosa]|uniref:Cytochrome P450 n=2 Tax=Onchocerca flexuosa TaxID=387005 RepID=A0A183HHR0_9BILA|nr:hypothetical protein X798_06169 [Onchocerca flexuosa]VDO48920.1 unnamed protein product [Onchocerca flexuosa]